MKINLQKEEIDALEQMVKSGANYVKVLEKVFDLSIEDLKNIENIDPKGNMGLQALARQTACEQVRAMKELVFSPQHENRRGVVGVETGPTGPRKVWR